MPALVPRVYVPPSDRLLLVISDIEMGTGGDADDFPQTDFIGELLEHYNASGYANHQIELIFNGDTFDFLKVPIDGCYPHHITANIANQKLEKVAAAHGAFFQGIQRFLSYSPERKVHFLAGNHDLELLFPSVKEAIKGLIGNESQVFFHDLMMRTGDVQIEHGHQKVEMFRVDPKALWLSYKGEQILNLPWANVALLDAVMPLQPMLYAIDRIKPKSLFFEKFPEFLEFWRKVYWEYWTRGFWKWGDPLKKVRWRMLKEVLRTIVFYGPDSILSPARYRTELMKSSDARVFLVGHEHEAGWWSRYGRKLLYTGCFRNEYLLEEDGQGQFSQHLLPKVYAEVWMQRERTARSHLVEVEGPTPPEGYQPNDFSSILQAVLESQSKSLQRS